jgi:hypothetical protein
MTAVAPRQDVDQKLKELDELTQKAWAEYADALKDLTGEEYERAESESWEHLQRELSALDDERAELVGTRGGRTEKS